MFRYFGYGSNINAISLMAKGVVPMRSEIAILPGWILKFNVRHWFDHEGGMANIVYTGNPKDVVEGVLHFCNSDDMAVLDRMEAYGVGYDRVDVELQIVTQVETAQAYVGLPDYLDNNCLPSRRYLNIILNGAAAVGLSKEYVDALRQQPVLPELIFPPFEHPPGSGQVYTKSTLALHPELTALAGAVFDMSAGKSKLDGFKGLLGGKDMTVFYLKRHDTSTGNETIDTYLNHQITAGQQNYLNAYLQAYAREYRYVGRFMYQDSGVAGVI